MTTGTDDDGTTGADLKEFCIEGAGVLIGLLGAGGSKGDGPSTPLHPSAPSFVPSNSIIDSVLRSWNQVDNWSSLGNPLSLFRRAYYLLVTVDRISPSSPCRPRRFYKRVVFLMNAFRIRWNRRTRRCEKGSSPLREVCNMWLEKTSDCSSLRKADRRWARMLLPISSQLLGAHTYNPSRPIGYLNPTLNITSSLHRLFHKYTRLRESLLGRGRSHRRPPQIVPPPIKESIRILVWNVGSDINAEPQHSILVKALRSRSIDVACLQEFRNNGILLPLFTLRPIAVWPSSPVQHGHDSTPHTIGGSLIASRLGYLTRNSSTMQGSIEFNSVCLAPDLHIINVYLPYTRTESRGLDYDDSHFLAHVRSLALDAGLLIAGDFNVNLQSMDFARNTPRKHTLFSLLDDGFEILNPVDADGRYCSTHFSSSSRVSSAIDIVLWRGHTGQLHRVKQIQVEILSLNSRDHFGLLVYLNGKLPRSQRRTPTSAYKAFAECIETAPPRDDGSLHTSSELDCKSAHELWEPLLSQGLDEDAITTAVARWHKAKAKREQRMDPLFSRYFDICSKIIAWRESIIGARSIIVLRQLLPRISDASRVQCKLRRDISRRSTAERLTRGVSEAAASGEDAVVRRFLLSTLRPHGNCLDLSSLTPEEFERFRTYYSECWDPPQLPPPDLSFLDSDSAPVPLLSSAIHHDITGDCNVEELLKALSTLHNRKAPGPSQVTVDFYKSAQTNPDILDFLMSLVNQCLSGQRPKCLDACKLVLLFKKGDRADPSNWRPVNLTNAAFRVCEAVIHARLVGWSERILSENAFGFRKGRRAEDVSYLLANKLHRAKRLRIPIHLIALDIAKAFDTAPHDQLLLSLARAGLSMASVRVVACMLLGHTSLVGQQERSFAVRIRRGVLQGGILSPLIFNIFFDQGISSGIPGILPLSYADDLSVCHVGPAPPSDPSSQARFHALLSQKRALERLASRPLSQAELSLSSSSSSESDEDDSRSLQLPLRQRRLLVMDEEADECLLTAASRDSMCRDQVNAYLSSRDSWLRSRNMRHNANKSEAVILNCSSDTPVRLSADLIPIHNTIRVLGSQPSSTGFCTRPESRHAGLRAALLFKTAWLKCRQYVTLQDMRSLLMAFVYSHSVFGTCLQKMHDRARSAPMHMCIRDALLSHPSASTVVCYEFLGLMTPQTRAISLRLNFLLRLLDPLSPRLIREEFLQHRHTSPWFRACLLSFSKLPQPKVGLNLCDRLHACIETLEAPAVDLPMFYSHPVPDDLHAVLVTDGSATLDEDSIVGPAGWGYLLFFNGKTYSACGHLSMSTSGNAEAMAIYHGLEHSQRLSAPFVHVRTDNSSCKELLDGNWFPDNIGCLRLYLFLQECTAQVHCYKVFSHCAEPHRDILNDAADELAARGRSGLSECVVTDTTEAHLDFLRLSIPRFNPGKEGEEPPPPPSPVSSHLAALSSFKQTVQSCIRASQMLSHLEMVRCNFRWINYTGVPPAIVGAKIMHQQYLYHLRYDLQEHFSRHSALHVFRSTCPFCGSPDNTNVHRVFICNQSESVSTQDFVSLTKCQIALRRYRLCYTSSLPLDEQSLLYPRSDIDYLFWMSSSQMLIVCTDGVVRPLSLTQMQLLADASFGLHRLYIKYSMINSPDSPASDARVVDLPRRSANEADCTLISERLDNCRSYEEVGAWYRWHGYTYSTIIDILNRSGRNGLLPMPLRSRLLKLEFLLAACLCPYLESRRIIFASHSRGNSNFQLPTKLWNLLREGNHMRVPVCDRDRHVVRPYTRHIDMPVYFHFLPFHYMNSSVLVEAWFAAPSLAERRSLIFWPPSIDCDGVYPLRIDRLWDFYQIPEPLFKVTGGGSSKKPCLQLHPSIQLIYDLLKQAILNDNVRVAWRARHNLDLQVAALKQAQQIKRRLYLSLIVGDLHEIRNYRPPGAVTSYTHSPAFESILCVPVCYQQRAISSIPGHSLPVRGPGPHPPRSFIYDRVHSMVAAFKGTTGVQDLDAAPELLLRVAHTAMAEAATVWARELIENTRDPACPAEYFPQLDRPAIAAPDDADDQFPVARPVAYFSEDEDNADEASPLPSDDD